MNCRLHRNLTLVLLLVSAGLFYLLADLALNPLIFWTALPLYVGYALVNKALKRQSVQKLQAAYAFLLFSVAFSLFYHWAWYSDWEQTRSGASTSALIFIIFPVWSLVVGGMAYGVVRWIQRITHNPSNR